MHCVFYNDSDGCTYSCSTLMGIFESHGDAETAVLKHVETLGAYQQRYAECQAESRALLDRWKLAKQGTLFADKIWDEYRASVAAWEKEKNETFHGGINGSTDLDKYDIREVAVGRLYPDGA